MQSILKQNSNNIKRKTSRKSINEKELKEKFLKILEPDPLEELRKKYDKVRNMI